MPLVEAAMRDFVKMRIDRANARINAKPDGFVDPVTRMRDRTDNMMTAAAILKKVADAVDALYKTLDDGQKRRLAILTRMQNRFRSD